VALCFFKSKFSFVFKILLYKNVFLKMKESMDWFYLKWIFYQLNLFRNTVIRSFLVISFMNYSAKLFLYLKVNKIFFRILKILKDNYRILMESVFEPIPIIIISDDLEIKQNFFFISVFIQNGLEFILGYRSTRSLDNYYLKE
jgi:hypothetical protein